MLRKSIATGIILLFLLSSLLPFVLSDTLSFNRTIYVDDDNTNGPWDGTQEHPYQFIQNAIDAAFDGDIIFVYNGTYYEELEITKNNISLIGENRDNTVINGDGGGGGIYLYFANWIIISGFTIKNYAWGFHLEQSEYVTIENNNITDHNSRGLYVEDGSKYLKILNNSITNNGNIGINFDWRGTGYSTISGNIISGNKDAGLWLTISYTNKIYGNDFRNNGIAIHLGESDRNDIIGNNFISNEKHVDLSNSFSNIWLGNYWDNWPGLIPKPIFGRIGIYGFIPWINFDWHPAQEPYELVVCIEVGPYTQNVNDDSITVVWETNIPTTDNYVMFGETTDYEHVMQGESDCYHHEITITPSFSLGYYKIVSDNEESNDLTFKLASHCHTTREFKCVIIGDSRGTWDNWKHATIVANAVNEESPDFVIHGGDMVTDGTKLSEWDSWLTLMKPLMQNSTVFGVMGNHERKGSRYYEIFALPNNEKWYCFDYGPCHFIILDNYELWNVGSSQYEWLEEDLQTTDKPFKIICFHEPIYCSGGHSPRTDVRAVWEPLFNKYNVNLVFQSHCHYYQRTNDINGTTYIVSGGAGAPLYTPKDAWFVNNSQKAYHYCVLDVSLATMEITFSARYVNGTTFDEFIVCPPVVS